MERYYVDLIRHIAKVLKTIDEDIKKGAYNRARGKIEGLLTDIKMRLGDDGAGEKV